MSSNKPACSSSTVTPPAHATSIIATAQEPTAAVHASSDHIDNDSAQQITHTLSHDFLSSAADLIVQNLSGHRQLQQQEITPTLSHDSLSSAADLIAHHPSGQQQQQQPQYPISTTQQETGPSISVPQFMVTRSQRALQETGLTLCHDNSPSTAEELLHGSSVSIPHHMTTRSQRGITKPNPKYALNSIISASIPREPRTVRSALVHPGWKAAMEDELTSLHQNQTWQLVPRTKDMHVIGSKWVFKTKLKSDGTLDRLKARVVAKGYHQIDGLDYTETFSLVVKPGTIRLIISIALVHHWPLRQLDVKNAFLHGLISETIYMEQPPGIVYPHLPQHVCKLQRALYGLKQAPRAWFDRFSAFLLQYGFHCSLADPSLFIFHSDYGSLILLLYVDDILLTGTGDTLVTDFITLLSQEFVMKDLGPAHHFLGIEISQTQSGLHLSQSHYAHTILERADMVDCKPMSTPLEAKTTDSPNTPLMEDVSFFRGLVGSLQYLTLTRPDLSFGVNYVSQFMHAPTIAHLKMVRRILRYVKGTINNGLHFTSTTKLHLSAFSDVD
jgi:hypothetical protein